MSFLIETLIGECLEALSRFLARRYGWAGCLIPLAAIALVIAVIIWAS